MAGTTTFYAGLPGPGVPSVTPDIVTQWTVQRAHRTVVHRIIGAGNPVVTNSGPAVGWAERSGTWQVWCTGEAMASQVMGIFQNQVVAARDPVRAAANMNVHVSTATSEPAGDNLQRWLVTAQWVDVGGTIVIPGQAP